MAMKSGRIVVAGAVVALLWGAARLSAAPVPTESAPAKSVAPTPLDFDELLAYLPAVVGRYRDRDLTATEVRKVVAPQLRMKADTDKPEVPPDFREWVYLLVKSMLQQQLLMDLASQDGYQPNPAEAKQALDRMVRNVGMEKYRQALREQGVTAEEVGRRLAEGLAINRWINDKVKPKNEVTEVEARTFYDEHRDGPLFQVPETIRTVQILIRVMPGATDAMRNAARERAEDLRRQLAAGAAFAELAGEHSDHPSAKAGGDLGYLPRGRMPEAYEEAAFALADGEISDVVETRLGYHLIKRVGVREPHTGRFEDVKERLVRELERRRVQEAVHKLFEKAVADGDVEIRIPVP